MPWTPMLDVKLIRSISRSCFRSRFPYSEAGKGQRPPGRDILGSSHSAPVLKHHQVLLPREGSLLPLLLFVLLCESQIMCLTFVLMVLASQVLQDSFNIDLSLLQIMGKMTSSRQTSLPPSTPQFPCACLLLPRYHPTK